MGSDDQRLEVVKLGERVGVALEQAGVGEGSPVLALGVAGDAQAPRNDAVAQAEAVEANEVLEQVHVDGSHGVSTVGRTCPVRGRRMKASDGKTSW